MGLHLVAAAVLRVTQPAPPPRVSAERWTDDPRLRVEVDSAHREIVVTAGPYRLPNMPMEMHHDGVRPEVLRFDWPVDGWLRGFRIEMRDSAGAPLPREILHHLIAVNFDRRQLVYPAVERLFGWSKETDAVKLPKGVGVPLQPGERLGVYASWHNDTGRDIAGAYLRVTLLWIPRRSSPTPVLPLYVDVNNVIGGVTTFDLPPGKSTQHYEFTLPVGGRLIAAGGHLHDYGLSVRLEDAETGKVLVRLKAKHDHDGHVTKVGRFIFGFRADALALAANHRYRVVSEYDNPTGKTIRQGGMGHINGAFEPDDLRKWPPLDPNDPELRKDVAALPLAKQDMR